jgi:hypothetical protein
VDVRLVSVGKARALITEEKSKGKRPKRKSPIIEQYEALLKGMGRRRSLLITLDENDKFPTVKYRLNSAAKYLGIRNLRIERAGNKVVVYREPAQHAVKTHGTAVHQVRQVTEEAMLQQESPVTIAVDDVESSADSLIDESKVEATEDQDSATTGDSTIAEIVSETEVREPVVETPKDTGEHSQEEELYFDEEWAEPMLRGRKTCETMTEKYPRKTFWAFGDEYSIIKAERMLLGDVSEKWFREHGCYSPKEFREVWKVEHGGVFDPDQKVWVHHFKKAFEVPQGEPVE